MQWQSKKVKEISYLDADDVLPKEIIEKYLEESNYMRLAGAVLDEDSKIKVKCLGCGTEKIIAWRSIKDNCIICVRKQATKTSYDRVVNIAKKHNYTVIDSFDNFYEKCEKEKKRNSLIKIRVLCPQGHESSTTTTKAAISKWRCVTCLENNT